MSKSTDKQRRANLNPQRKARLLRQLRARDGDNCQWCHQPIDFTIPRGEVCDPMGWTFDHIRGHADGGTYTRDNLQLMHWKCNHEEGKWEALARKWRGTR